ncbi:MAG: ROK family protein [Candidatus Eremiobacteraeota bacterium]|nr:ROK family protein [Candidatus Eremiobacteraeota bacterium]
MPDDTYVIGVDLGGTHVAAAVVDISGKVFYQSELPVDISLTPDEIFEKSIFPAIETAINKAPGKISGIGMGLPGHIDSRTGICRFSPNFQWHNVEVTSRLTDRFGLNSFVMNDVRVATLGEQRFGAGRGIDNFVLMAIGTGIGGGIINNGELVMGALESAGEIGHMTILPDGPPCNCGNRGCLEVLCSGPNIARRYREALEKGEGELPPGLNSIDEATAKTIHRAAIAGDTLSLKIWEETGRYLGIGISNLITILNPDRVLLGGRVAKAIDLFLPVLKEEINRRVHMVPKNFTEIVPAALGENAGMMGGAALALLKLEIT